MLARHAAGGEGYVVRLNLGGLRSMLDKSKVDTELARRFCAAFVSYQLGQYRYPVQEDAGRGRRFVVLSSRVGGKLAREGQDVFYDKLGALATTLIQ